MICRRIILAVCTPAAFMAGPGFTSATMPIHATKGNILSLPTRSSCPMCSCRRIRQRSTYVFTRATSFPPNTKAIFLPPSMVPGTGKNARVPFDHSTGKARGEYEDFVTGFVTRDGNVWGRPVGITVAKDGSLLFSEDGNGTIWRVSYGR